MCGVAGLSIGCSTLSFCPRKMLSSADPGTADRPGESVDEYRSPFGSWYERASVRQAPRRVLLEETDGQRFFFSPELVPVARHALVAELERDLYAKLLIKHLYRYLDFTAKLESLVINRTLVGIANGSVGVLIPREMRLDSLKMYCDEAFHTLFSVDLADQVEMFTGIPRVPVGKPFFYRRLERIQQALPTDRRALAELLFVIVSETLISATLAEAPKREGEGVVGAVSDTIRDHAVDEGRHHAYFAAFLRYLWSQLDRESRNWAGALVPALVDAFLRPDLAATEQDLRDVGFTGDVTGQIMAEVYEPYSIKNQIRKTASRTIQYFSELGVLDNQEALESFHSHGLLE